MRTGVGPAVTRAYSGGSTPGTKKAPVVEDRGL